MPFAALILWVLMGGRFFLFRPMALTKWLQNEISRADRDASYRLFSGDRLLPEDYTLYTQTGQQTYDYHNLELDPQVYSKLQTRKLGILARELKVEAGGTWKNGKLTSSAADLKAAALAEQVIKNPSFEFDRICFELLDALLVGYKVGEIIWQPPTDGAILPSDVRVRDENWFTFVRAGAAVQTAANSPPTPAQFQTVGGYELRFLSNPGMTLGERLPLNKFIVHSFGSKSGNPLGVGLGNKLFFLTQFKTEITKNWLIFSDRFAQPIPYGEYEVGADRQALEEFLSQISNGSWACLPTGFKVAFLEAQRSGSLETYKSFEDWCDSQIAKVIIGQSAGPEANQGLSGAPAANDEAVRLEVQKADADLLSAALQRYLWAPLTLFNIPKAKPPIVWRVFSEEEDLNTRVNRDKSLYDMGFRLTMDAVKEIYGDHYEDTNAAEQDPGALIAGLAGGGTPPTPTQPEVKLAQGADPDLDSAVIQELTALINGSGPDGGDALYPDQIDRVTAYRTEEDGAMLIIAVDGPKRLAFKINPETGEFQSALLNPQVTGPSFVEVMPQMTMLGLWPPAEVAKAIVIPEWELPGREEPEDLHLTLAYYGKDPDLSQLPEWQQALNELAQVTPPFAATVNGYGRFSAPESSDGKDVIYATVDAPGLVELRQALVELSARFGLEVKANHGFTPHITLAYIDPGIQYAPEVPVTPWLIDRITLTVGAAQYTFLLAGEPPAPLQFAEGEPEDPIALVSEKAAAQYQEYVNQALGEVGKTVRAIGQTDQSDTEKYASLKQQIAALFPTLRDRYAAQAQALFAQSFTLSSLIGRDEVVREVKADT